jgi:hypothetical protein
MIHIYGYLKKKFNSRLAFVPSYPDINEADFQEYDWK